MTDRIFRIGASGIESSEERMKALMSNMVNAQTPGYRKADVVTRAFPLEFEEALKKAAMEPVVEGSYYNQSPGSLIRTGGKTDIAISGDGFFVVEGEWGEGYTRDGRFTLDKEGRLVSIVGNFPLLGEAGPIIIPSNATIEITQTGQVKADDIIVDRIRMVKVDDPNSLESVNGSIFRNPGNLRISNVEAPRVIQGYIESSNASMIDAMMELVMLSRIYNIDTKIISTRDAALTRALELGKPTQ